MMHHEDFPGAPKAKMKVLCVDGPARGNVHDIEGNTGALFRIPSVVSPGHIVVYYVHNFQIAGMMMRIASVHLMSDDIRPYDVFDLVVSDLAKQAAV